MGMMRPMKVEMVGVSKTYFNSMNKFGSRTHINSKWPFMDTTTNTRAIQFGKITEGP